MSSSAKETILANIRRHLAGATPPPDAHRPGHGSPVPPSEASTESAPSLAETFADSFVHVGGQLQRVPSFDAAKAHLFSLLRKYGARRVFSSDTERLHAWLRQAPADLLPQGELVTPASSRTSQLEAELGITEAQFGIAETGTLVLRSDAERHRFASLLPRIHIAVLSEHALVPDLEGALRRLRQHGLPPAVTFISGPSRTADIEQTLVVGVHGPETLHVVLVAEAASPSGAIATALP